MNFEKPIVFVSTYWFRLLDVKSMALGEGLVILDLATNSDGP